MAKLAKFTMYTSGKPVYLAIDKIISISETESYERGKQTTIESINGGKLVRESAEEAAKIIEEAARPVFVFGDINTEREDEE
jgi:hypothetical protein